MIDVILRAAKSSNSKSSNTGKFMWHQVALYISRLFEKQSPTSLNRVITLVSPYAPWEGTLNSTIAVTRWAAATSAIPYTEEVGQSVVDTLFQIAYIDFLRPHIPLNIWELLKRQPSLPPMYHGMGTGGKENVVAHVRRLGDIEILKSYFLLLWTHLYQPSSAVHVMERSIREDFGGIRMEKHRKDLVKRLDHVLGQLKHAPHNTFFRDAEREYTMLRDALLELDRQ